MVNHYDNAIIKMLRKLFDDTRISILPVENSIKFAAQLEKDNVSFPLVSITRVGYSIQKEKISHPALFRGGPVRVNDNNSMQLAQVLPIRIEYQLDLYTVDRVSNDEIMREFIFYVFQHPTLEVEIQYTVNSNHKFNIFMDSDIVDNSDIMEHVNNGVLFRSTCTFYTDDAYLFAGEQQSFITSQAVIATTDKEAL